MNDKKIAVLCGAPIRPSEINAIFARVMNDKKETRRNKSDRKRNKSNRWR